MEVFDLKRFRKERNLQQNKLAEALGVSQSFLSYIEHGKRPAPAEMLEKLCQMYNIDDLSDYISYADISSTSVGNGNNNVNMVNSQGTITATQSKHVDSLITLLTAYEKRLTEADKKIEQLEKELSKYRTNLPQ